MEILLLGLVKKTTFSLDVSYVDVGYCEYGMLYRKKTRLWSNILQWSPKPLCKKDCGGVNGNRHKATAQKMLIGKEQNGGNQPLLKQVDLYVIRGTKFTIFQNIIL